MAASEHYRRQVALLVRILPVVAEEAVFALKGGTAINLFIRDLPRLSVDMGAALLRRRSRGVQEGLRAVWQELLDPAKAR